MLGSTLASAIGALLAVVPGVSGAGLYPKSSQVLQIDGKNYDNLIAKSNYTSVSFPSFEEPIVVTKAPSLAPRPALLPYNVASH